MKNPPYLQISQVIRDRIMSGQLPVGSTVPSTREIQKEFEVAGATATKALKVLAEEGLTDTRPGLRATVKSNTQTYKRAEDRLKAQRTTGKFHNHGETSAITTATITTDVPAQVVADLRLESGEPAIKRHRITYRDNQPVEVSTSWFDARLAASAPLLVGKQRIEGGTTAYICKQMNLAVTRGMERQSVRLSTPEEAHELRRGEPLPVLITEHVAYAGDEPICSEIGVSPPGFVSVRTYNLE
jgi:DNA-binding GntR family transcriptional regulator